MKIQRLSSMGGVQSYYRAREISPAKTEETDALMQQTSAESQKDSDTYSQQSQQPLEDHRSKTADLENISLTFNKEESFDYLGSESGLDNLDMQKAISDMRKDQVLQEYQYFVGRSSSLFESQDGTVIPK